MACGNDRLCGGHRGQPNLDQRNRSRGRAPKLFSPVGETVQLEFVPPAIRALLQTASFPSLDVLPPKPPLGLQCLGSLIPCHDDASLALKVHSLRRPSVTNFQGFEKMRLPERLHHQRVSFGVGIPELMVTFNHSSQRETLEYLCIQDDEVRSIYMNEI